MITFIKSVRTVKISSLITKNRWSKTHKPKITLSGVWLAHAGFQTGDKVTIIVSDNRLIIEKQ